MSLHSQILTDHAWLANRFETNVNDTEGDGSSVYGTPTKTTTGFPIRSTESKTGGTYSWTFSNSSDIVTVYPNNYTSSNSTNYLAGEIVFKASAVSNVDTPIATWSSTAAGNGNDAGYIYIRQAAYTGYAGLEIKQGNNTYNLTSTTNICDNKWHHVAVYADTTGSMKIYVDGTQVATSTSGSTASFNWVKNACRNRVPYPGNGFSSFKVDLVAFYSSVSGYTPTTTMLLQHAGLFTDYIATETPATAAALIVNPVITTTKQVNFTQTSMTASAVFALPSFNTTDFFPSLEEYLLTYPFEHRYRHCNIYGGYDNYNYGAQAWMDDYNLTDWGNFAFKTDGPDFTPYVRYYDEQSLIFREGDDKSMNIALSDNDWYVGYWFRSDLASTFDVLKIGNFNYDTETYTQMLKNTYEPGVGFTFELDSDDHYPIAGTEVSADEWHYVSMTFDGEEFITYIDGQFVGSVSCGPGDHTISQVMLGSPSGGYFDTTDFIVSASTDVTSGENNDIYVRGMDQKQALALMPQNSLVRFNTKYNDIIEGYGAVLDLRFDDFGGYPTNYGTSTGAQIYGFGPNYNWGNQARNIRAYEFTNTDSAYGASFQLGSGVISTNQELTISFIAKMETPAEGALDFYLTQFPYISPTDDYGVLALANKETGPTIQAYDNGGMFVGEIALAETFNDAYHHFVIVLGTGGLVKLYIDGQLQASDTTSFTIPDSLDYRLGAGDIDGQEARTVSRFVDEFAVMPVALTDQEIFELYQSITIDGAFLADALFEVPIGVAGYGPTIYPGVMYVSALLVDPTQQDTVRQLPIPLTAFGAFAHPNYAATKTVTITPTPLTASAEFHEPQFDIGEINGVASMDAQAYMPEAYARIPGRWNASPMIASPAQMVMPAFVSTRGGLWNATPLTAKAQFVLPPAYKSLQDDLWYRELYLQHSQTNGERWKTDNIAGSAGTSSAYAFLKLFDDVTGDLNGSNTSKLTNNLPWNIVIDSPSTVDTLVTYAVAENEFLTAANTPVLEYGYYDDSQRKAVKFNNISFKIPENQYTAQNKNYSVEFNIKTTKSDQILLQGTWKSWLYYGVIKEAIGLSNGKLYGIVADGAVNQTLHPKNLSLKSIQGRVNGNKRIDDGFWHHIVIQYGLDNRTQFWIDGELDIQMYATQQNSGLNIRPYVIGYNSKDDAYQSDFQTSIFSYDAAAFISQTDIVTHNAASFKYEPIKAEPMIASIGLTTGSRAAGNRGRALMLYFWPVNTELARTSDRGRYGEFDVDTFDSDVLTIDYIKNPPQTWFGWDLYPVDVNGYYVSDLVNVDSYGEENIVLQDLGGTITQSQNYSFPQFKANRRGWFRDPKTDDRRYIDLIKDLDLANFEVICFRNYPDQSEELDSYARNEVVDSYFNIRESNIFEDFVKSLRAAIDTGIGLYVTNHQLAIDLGIVDRVEIISDLDDMNTDLHAPTVIEDSGYPVAEDAEWFDTFKNNRLRIRNTVAGLTDLPGVIWKDVAYYRNSDVINFGGADRPFESYEVKNNGLAVGDEIVISDFKPGLSLNYLATPIANIKAGKAVTTFAAKNWKGNAEVDNPYANYATSIVVEPGDQLNGKPISGKIYVNFTERMNVGLPTRNSSTDYGRVDLIQDYWINFAYDQLAITLDEKNELLASPNNIDRKLEAELITQEQYDKLAYWSSNGNYILAQATQEIGIFDTSPGKSTIAKEKTRAQVKKFNKKGAITTAGQAYSTTQFFKFAYSWKYSRLTLDVPSMLTRGWWWLSNREIPEGLINRVPATTASATMGQATVVVDKVITVNAAPMLTVANMSQPTNYTAGSARIAALPLQAYAMINQWVINQSALPMLATATFRPDNRAITSSIDEVILYVMHEDPILYVREDVTK